MGSNRRRKPSYNVPCNEDSGSEHSLSDGNPESELEGESSPVTRRPEKICNEAGNFSDPAESEAEGEEDQPASRDSPSVHVFKYICPLTINIYHRNGPSRGRKRSSSFLSSNSDPNVENISVCSFWYSSFLFLPNTKLRCLDHSKETSSTQAESSKRSLSSVSYSSWLIFLRAR